MTPAKPVSAAVHPAPAKVAPTTDIAPHLRAWADLMAACAGVPPLPEGVTMLPGKSA